MKGVKESVEVLKAVRLLSVSGVEIFKDGLGADDIPKALKLVENITVLIEGVKGVDQIPGELKELDEADLIQLGTEAYAFIKELIEVVKSKKEQ